MRTEKNKTIALIIAGSVIAAVLLVGAASAQRLDGPPADPHYKYSTPMPPDVAVPDKVETRLGTLGFDAGVPDAATAQKVFDNLDFQHAVQAYLLASR